MAFGEVCTIALYSTELKDDLKLAPHAVNLVEKVDLDVNYMVFDVCKITEEYLDPIFEGLRTRQDSIVYLSPILGEIGLTSKPVSEIKKLCSHVFSDEESILKYIMDEEKDEDRYAIYNYGTKHKSKDAPWMKHALSLSKQRGVRIIGKIDGIYFNCEFNPKKQYHDESRISVSRKQNNFWYGDVLVKVSKPIFDNMDSIFKINDRISDSYSDLNQLGAEVKHGAAPVISGCAGVCVDHAELVASDS